MILKKKDSNKKIFEIKKESNLLRPIGASVRRLDAENSVIGSSGQTRLRANPMKTVRNMRCHLNSICRYQPKQKSTVRERKAAYMHANQIFYFHQIKNIIMKSAEYLLMNSEGKNKKLSLHFSDV